ncbi:RNA polymerase sigma-54 factor RpoN [Labilithrix luteola]|uniref:RNA polymerase sigma-54 factor RpoN n=1 Tax=Labilithrix luteola TaxID=1391654 RepID=A0A0K1PXK4_9BACT|nr:RNA polymerase sigma factor [Labilithrix luteola]AKU98248.1 RNA polymerase sigma-54 factor RpoN [Labilithrix luteola]
MMRNDVMKAANDLAPLVERAQAGDRDALEGVVRALQDRLYRLSLRMLGHPEPARDATQEILILVVTQLSTFRGESSVETWAYRVATNHLLRARHQRGRKWNFETLAGDLGQSENEIAADTRALADEQVLEEEVFIGCTQAMLQSLDKSQRIAFVLGALCDLDSSEAAWVLDITEVTFRKRLSRARAALDAFLEQHCGVANPENACRCVNQVNLNVEKGRINPSKLRYPPLPVSSRAAGDEVLETLGDIRKVRRSLEIYRGQPTYRSPEDFANRLRHLLDGTRSFSLS